MYLSQATGTTSVSAGAQVLSAKARRFLSISNLHLTETAYYSFGATCGPGIAGSIPLGPLETVTYEDSMRIGTVPFNAVYIAASVSVLPMSVYEGLS